MEEKWKETAISYKRLIYTRSILAILIFSANPTFAENIDPYDDGSQYAYGENVGWLNFEPNQGPGVTVGDANLIGFAWAENIGWINLDPNDSDPNTGIANDGTGLLSGFAWGENVGWINFNPQVPDDPVHYGVIIDGNSNFDGWAWGENIGWIHFQSASPVAYKVQTSWTAYTPTPYCIVDYDDLAEFCKLWLQVGAGLEADFDGSNDVDFMDYCTLADNWLETCPEDWPFKD